MGEKIFIPDCGKLRLMNILMGFAGYTLDSNATVRIYDNPVSAKNFTVAEDFHESPLAISPTNVLGVAPDPLIDAHGNAYTVWPYFFAYTLTDLVTPALALGYFVTDNHDGTLLWCQKFDTPGVFTLAGDFILVYPRLEFGQLVLFVNLPAVTDVSPYSGDVSGGDTITVTGTFLAGVTAVNFGSNPAAFTVNSEWEIVAVAPPGVNGTVDITVKTAAGWSWVTPADIYVYSSAAESTAVAGDASAVADVEASSVIDRAGSAAAAGEADVLSNLADGSADAAAVAETEVTANLAAGAGEAAAVAAVIAGEVAAGAGAAAAVATVSSSSLVEGIGGAFADADVRTADAITLTAQAAVAVADVEVTSNLADGGADADATADVEVSANIADGDAAGAAAASVSVPHNVAAGEGSAAAVGEADVLENLASGAGHAAASAHVVASASVSASGHGAAVGVAVNPITTFLSDTFTGTNGTALSSHTMDVGPGWAGTGGLGTWTIQGNKAQNSLAASGTFYTCSANAGAGATAPGVYVQCDCVFPTVGAGTYTVGLLGWNDSSANNAGFGYELRLRTTNGLPTVTGNLILFQISTATQLATVTGLSLAAGTTYTLKMLWDGTNMKCYINGVLQITHAASLGTKDFFGLVNQQNISGNIATYDNFKVSN
jgi:hypothetical protein